MEWIFYIIYTAIVALSIFSMLYIAKYGRHMVRLHNISRHPVTTAMVQDTTIVDGIKFLTAREAVLANFVMIPFSFIVVVMQICTPIYLQTDIPLPIAIILSGITGWLFTYMIRKDFHPEWIIGVENLAIRVSSLIPLTSKIANLLIDLGPDAATEVIPDGAEFSVNELEAMHNFATQLESRLQEKSQE